MSTVRVLWQPPELPAAVPAVPWPELCWTSARFAGQQREAAMRPPLLTSLAARPPPRAKKGLDQAAAFKLWLVRGVHLLQLRGLGE